MLALVSILVATGCLAQDTGTSLRSGEAPPLTRLKGQLALSLNALQQALADGSVQPEQSLRLTKVAGLTFDENGDPVLLGIEEEGPAAVPICADDVVLALRNVLMHHGAPGMSIDPRRADRKEVEESAPLRSQRALIDPVQDVVYFGGIEGTRAGWYCYNCDYWMKCVGAGQEPPPLAGFKRYCDLILEDTPANFANGRANRFWFYPKAVTNLSISGGQIILIPGAGVEVLTETEHVSLLAALRGKGESKGDIDLLARRFADQMTARYPELAVVQPDLSRMESFFALCELFQLASSQIVTPKLNYLLHQYEVVNRKTPRTVDTVRVNFGNFVLAGGVMVEFRHQSRIIDSPVMSGLSSRLGRRRRPQKVLTPFFTKARSFFPAGQGIPQPMAVAAENLSISSQGSVTRPAFCLEPRGPAPEGRTRLNQVLNQENRSVVWVGERNVISLAQAIRDGILEVETEGLAAEKIRFANLSEKPLKIELQAPLVLGDVRAPFNEAVINHVKMSRTVAEHERLQDAIWRDQLALYLAEAKPTPNQFFRSEVRNPHVLGFQRSENRFLVLWDGITDVELAVVENGQCAVSTASDGHSAVEKLESLTAEAVAGKSTERLCFLYLRSAEKGISPMFRLQFANQHLEISMEELQAIAAGSALPKLDKVFASQSGPRQFIVVRDILQQTRDAQEWRTATIGNNQAEPGSRDLTYEANGRLHVDPLVLVRALEARYSRSHEFYLDDELGLGRKNVEQMPRPEGPENVTCLSDKGSFPVNDHGLIGRIEIKLREVGIRVVNDPKDIATANLLVLTGHKDDAYRNWVSNLALSGNLAGKCVAMFSCYEGGEAHFNSQLLQGPDAPTGIIFFTEKIHAEAVKDVLSAFGEFLRDPTNRGKSFKTILNQCIESVLKDTPDKNLRKEVELMRSGIIQVSWLGTKLWPRCLPGVPGEESGFQRESSVCWHLGFYEFGNNNHS